MLYVFTFVFTFVYTLLRKKWFIYPGLIAICFIHWQPLYRFYFFYYFCMKRMTLYSVLCSSYCYFSANRVNDFGIVNRYSWCWKSHYMAYQGGKFNFSQGVHVRINIRIDISNSIRPMTTKFGKPLHLEKLTQVRPIKQVLVTPSYQGHVTN